MEMTTKLLVTLKDQKAPTVGFVNEQKLYRFGEVDDRIKALSLWLDEGFELGNHTFKHTSLNRVPLQAWEEDVARGETVTKTLLYQHHMKMRYLRIRISTWVWICKRAERIEVSHWHTKSVDPPKVAVARAVSRVFRIAASAQRKCMHSMGSG